MDAARLIANQPPPADGDPYRPDLVLDPEVPHLLRVFNAAGLLAPADVHTAVRLARLAGEADPSVVLAAALAVRAPRMGHVSVDLTGVRGSAVVGEDDVDVDSLPWPDPPGWVERTAASPLVAADGAELRPLRVVGSAVYLDRYWRDEVALAADLLGRAGGPPSTDGTAGGGPLPTTSDPDKVFDAHAALDRLFPGPESADQRAAAAATLARRLSVLAGGPGTGKTTTVARLLGLLCEQAEAEGRRPPLIALAAPTGKAAARMAEAVHHEAATMPASADVRALLASLTGATLHRLLGTRPDRPGRFRHHAGHRLPHEVVVVDEASMVSLSLMARTVEAVRPDARLVLVGDPDQLVSVEAGAVLGDIVGPARSRPSSGRMGGAVSVLRTNHRFGGDLSRLADAVRGGDADGVMAALRGRSAGDADACRWIDADPGEWLAPGPSAGGEAGPLAEVVEGTARWAGAIRAAALAGDGPACLASLAEHRVLCAHRHGPAGVAVWNRVVEGRLAGSGADTGSWYAGRPVMVTANDYGLRLFNGDLGVAVAAPADLSAATPGEDDGEGAALRVVFAGDGAGYSPYRLDAVETVFAMTVHKSQGSEFGRVTLLLPPSSSRLLTRELLYTAVTRAREGVTIVGTEDAVRAAVARPAARASGLEDRLWGDAAG